MKAASVVVLALTLSLAVAALTGCGAAPELARSNVNVARDNAGNADSALDADDAPPQLVASILSITSGGPASTRVVGQLGDKKTAGDVLIGSFIMGCGIGLQHGPFAADVDGGSFDVAIADRADNMMLIGAFVDTDRDGEFDADTDVVLAAGGYEGLDADGDGVVELSVVAADDWMHETIPMILLQATQTTVE